MVRKSLVKRIFALLLIVVFLSMFYPSPTTAMIENGEPKAEEAVADDSGRPGSSLSSIAATATKPSLGLQKGSIRVAVLGANSSASELTGVRDYLVPFSDLAVVDAFNVGTSTPTLSTLLNYDAVLVYNRNAWYDPVALGDVLADYVDRGGGVVLATFMWGANTGNYSLGGRINATDYLPFQRAGGNLVSNATLDWHNDSHPIMSGVGAIKGFYRDNVVLTAGAQLVASWNDTHPFVATKGHIVGMTLFPYSEASFAEWTGDVPTLVHNALLWTVPVPFGRIGIITTHGENLGGDIAGFYTALSTRYIVENINTTLALSTLENYDFVVVGDYGAAWTTSEIGNVTDYIASGGGFVAIGDQLVSSIQTILAGYGITLTGVNPPDGASSSFNALHPIMQGVTLIGAIEPLNSLAIAAPAYWIANDTSNTNAIIAGAEAGGRVLCLSDDFAANAYSYDNGIILENIANWMCARAYIVFEEAHLPAQTIDGSYKNFTNYLNASGYMVRRINPGTTINANVLAWVDVLVIVAPMKNYSISELDGIETWVKSGGSLLLISDFGPYGKNATTIASRFSTNLQSSMLRDADEYVGEIFWPYYTDGNLQPHPITDGVNRVEMYAGDGIASAPADEIPLIVTDTDGTATWLNGTAALGISGMSALDGGTAGRGKLVVITDTNLWASVDTDGDGQINFHDSDNEILALNTIDWLAQPHILVVNDNDGAGLFGFNTNWRGFAAALNAGNLDYWVWHESTMGRPTINQLVRFELVIWTCGGYYDMAVDAADAATLQSYLALGGNLLLEGSDIGYNHGSDSFMVNVAHATESADNAGGTGLTVTDSIHRVTHGLPTTFAWKTTHPFPDGVSPTNGGVDVLKYTGTSQTAVTAFDGGTAGGSVVYYSFPLYCLNATTRNTLTLNSVAWLMHAPRILAYVEYADYDEEYLHSKQAINSKYADDYVLTELKDDTQLASMLPENDILLVPEQETAGGGVMQTIGASWDATLDSFLGNGGVIIVCTFGGSTHGILTGAGLMSITSINPISYQTVYCVDPADRLAESVSSSFTAPNGALRFVTGEGNVVFNNGTSPVVIHKTVGYGQIALIGFDYFMSNSDADRVLGNAIRLYALPERAYLTVRGSNNGIYYRTYDLTTETWNSWTDAPGSTPDPPAVAVLDKGLHLVVRGATAGQIWHGTVNLNDNSFSGWSLFDGATPSAPALAANSTHLCMVVRGYNDAIYYRFYSLAADTWGAWQVVPAGTTLSTPGVAMAGNELHFAVRGSNNNEVWHSYINTQTGSFSGWTLLDGTTPSPPLLTGNNQRVCLVVRGDNNGIYYRWLNLRTKVWDDWTGFPFGMTPDVPAATLTGNNLQIVVRGMNNDQIWHGTLRAGAIGPVWSGWTLLDGSTPSKPVLAS